MQETVGRGIATEVARVVNGCSGLWVWDSLEGQVGTVSGVRRGWGTGSDPYTPPLFEGEQAKQPGKANGIPLHTHPKFQGPRDNFSKKLYLIKERVHSMLDPPPYPPWPSPGAKVYWLRAWTLCGLKS